MFITSTEIVEATALFALERGNSEDCHGQLVETLENALFLASALNRRRQPDDLIEFDLTHSENVQQNCLHSKINHFWVGNHRKKSSILISESREIKTCGKLKIE